LHAKATTDLPRDAIRFLEHISVERGASRNTLVSYRRDLIDFFSRHERLDQLAVSQFLTELRRSGLAESSIARKISSLRSLEEFLALSDATRIGWRVDLKARGRRLPKSLSYETIRKLLEAPDDSIAGIRDRAILESLYSAGMRVSECISLDVSQFVGEPSGTHFLRITGKGGKERMVPIGEHAAGACRDYLVRSRPALVVGGSEPALFLNGQGKRLSRQGVWQIIKRAAKRAGIKDPVTPHTFRHAFATHMLERGADVRSVQELLGHSSVVTTQIYTMVTGEVLRETHSVAHPRAT
jgi:integrase/recombinase XerD